jgi:TolA-binding protein
VESQEAEAERVFEIAKNLEKSGKAQEASEAYRQILRDYPETVQGKKAAERIKRVQRGK